MSDSIAVEINQQHKHKIRGVVIFSSRHFFCFYCSSVLKEAQQLPPVSPLFFPFPFISCFTPSASNVPSQDKLPHLFLPAQATPLSHHLTTQAISPTYHLKTSPFLTISHLKPPIFLTTSQLKTSHQLTISRHLPFSPSDHLTSQAIPLSHLHLTFQPRCTLYTACSIITTLGSAAVLLVHATFSFISHINDICTSTIGPTMEW